ncbi:MAG TPA: LLM class flavin-dependent oxidoreductase [Pseudonocardiaceae bacterium]
MEIGLQLSDFTWPGGAGRLGAELAETARAVDEAGFGYLALMDHFFQIPSVGPVEHDMLEAYTTLGFLAAHTRRTRLLTVIAGAFYRRPEVLVGAARTLHALSGGRGLLGVGAGWAEAESRALGVPFPSLARRFELLEDVLRQTRGVPVMVGGGGERKTLRFVAKYGDACNLFSGPQLPHKLDVLRRHCEAEGRDYAEITKVVDHSLDIGPRGERTGEFLAELSRLAALGVDAVIGDLPGRPSPVVLTRFADEIIPAAAALSTVDRLAG